MKAEEFYKQQSNSIRELWALSPKQIEYIGLIMEEYAALRKPLVSGELPISCVNDFEKPEYCSHRNNHLCQKCKDW